MQGYIKTDQREFLCAKIEIKISIVIKNVTGPDKTLMNKAEHPSNYFFQFFHAYQAEKIKEGVICVQVC